MKPATGLLETKREPCSARLTWCLVLSSTNHRGFHGFNNAPLLKRMPSKLLEAKTQVKTCLSCSLTPLLLRCTVYLQACDTAAELGGVTSARGLFKVRRPCRYRPVLALAALELAVEGAGARPTGDGRRSGAGFAVQTQVDGGSHTALLQVNALRAPLMAQVG